MQAANRAALQLQTETGKLRIMQKIRRVQLFPTKEVQEREMMKHQTRSMRSRAIRSFDIKRSRCPKLRRAERETKEVRREEKEKGQARESLTTTESGSTQRIEGERTRSGKFDNKEIKIRRETRKIANSKSSHGARHSRPSSRDPQVRRSRDTTIGPPHLRQRGWAPWAIKTDFEEDRT